MKMAIYYGSSNGNTESVAKAIRKRLGGKERVAMFDVANLSSAEAMQEYDILLWGCPTWGEGDLQDDWEDFYSCLDGIDLSGKSVALFGLGDQDGYGHEFVNALKILYDKATAQGANMIGFWPDEGYEYDSSEAVIDGKFVGLVIDEDNQSDLTEERIEKWCHRLELEMQ